MKALDGGICAPRGFQAAGVNAKIKNLTVTKKDCALVVSDHSAAIAGLFTTNVLKAPPVAWTEGVCIRGAGRAIFINSGNANACTGTRGLQDAQATAERLAAGLNAPITEVAVLSTGVIGVPLPMDRIAAGADAAIAALSPDAGHDAAVAIMTTDTVPKERAYEVTLSTGAVRLGAMAKGSGMISPNMATMISVITTDATLAAPQLHALLKAAVDVSFNCICVDNDMSTSDAVLCLANGASDTPQIVPGSEDESLFAEALRTLCIDMAHQLVRDGEGAKKFVEIQVSGTDSDDAAKTIARSIAQSQLCKTAFAGEDPNWGRIGCAAGYAGVPFNPNQLSISLDGLEVVHDGLPNVFEEAEAKAIMCQPAFVIRVRVGEGPGKATFWTCDLSHEYVSINADYRT